MTTEGMPDNGPPSGAVKPLDKKQGRPKGTQPQVPDHDILSLIGAGAYGEVWLARSVSGAYRAIKVVWREDFEDERSFVREFEGALTYEPIARANPGLVHILHMGQNHGEYPHYFYVMELADDAYTGKHIEPQEYTPRTLHSDLKMYEHHAMPLDYVLEVGSQLAHALVGLHAEELTHRDIKPANVVFVNGRAKLADAGLVAHNSKRSYVGTEGYIPPDGPGTPRADVYALAKVLYEIGTGKDRLEFPELPLELPEGATHRRWLQFNDIICRAAEPKIGKNTIVTAQGLADELDKLQGIRPNKTKQTPRKIPRVPRWVRSHRTTWLLTTALIVVSATHFIPDGMSRRLRTAASVLFHGEAPVATQPPPAPEKTKPEPQAPVPEPIRPVHVPHPAQPQPPAQSAVSRPTSGQLFIATVPSGASIYKENGEYVDETPYGPIDLPEGTRVSYIIRKEGYADTVQSGTVPAGQLLTLGGSLQAYRPPKTGIAWRDTQGTRYSPDERNHRADNPVTIQHFNEFLQERPDAQFPAETLPGTDLVRTSQDAISAFTLWLTRRCERAGTLGKDHCLIARPEPGTQDELGHCAYRLSTTVVSKTPINITTDPKGATVMMNGKLIGITPLQEVRVPIAPYIMEIKLPGYSAVRRSGLTPAGLSLDLALEPNKSVVFGVAWTNSLGLHFQPVSPSAMAGATEVRVGDYRAYCEATGTEMPEVQEVASTDQHPIVYVSRTDAENFARWLTARERELGLIEPTDRYRLPSDEEWSLLAMVHNETGQSPYERQARTAKLSAREFPWGLRWPPAPHTGNFADHSARPYLPLNHAIQNYLDDYPFTAPVATFPANQLKLHDIAGNVQEWVSGEYGGPEGFTYRHYAVTRGGDYTSFRPNQLHSAVRTPRPVHDKRPNVGFRLVLQRGN